MKRKLGLALSGGGIKAYCEIGVFRVFEENEISFDAFSGTSMGAIIAAFMACGLSSKAIEERMLKLEDDIIKDKLFTPLHIEFLPLVLKQTDGFINSEQFEKRLRTHFNELGIQNINQIPSLFVCVAVDLISGKPVLFTNDPGSFKKSKEYIIVSDIDIIKALAASCSFPLVFNTTKIKDLQLVDGGVMINIPVVPLKIMGLEKIISVSMQDISSFKTATSMIDIANRIFELNLHESDILMIESSDLNINVRSKNIGIFSMGKGATMIDKGYKTALKMFDKISQVKLQKKKFWI